MSELFIRLQQLSISKAIAIGIFIGAAYWFMSDDGSVLKDGIQANRQQIQAIQAQMVQLDAAVREVQEHQVRISVLGNELNTLSSYIPEKYTGVDLMKKVSGEAKAAGLDILGLTEGAAGGSSANSSILYESFDITADLLGSYSQHLLFLSFLTNLKSIVTVGDFDMTVNPATDGGAGAASDATLVRFKLKLNGYRYVANAAKDATQGAAQ
jgi:Tfp pilus assembly protein PilO